MLTQHNKIITVISVDCNNVLSKNLIKWQLYSSSDNTSTVSIDLPQDVPGDESVEISTERDELFFTAEILPSISEHIHSNTILLNVIMITYFVAQQQQQRQELPELEKDVANRDEVKDK